MSNYAENIIKILAGLPEFLREPMLRRRLNEFFSMSDEEKREMINNALDAIPEIQFDTLARLIKTWIKILFEFDYSKREEIFTLYTRVLASKPDTISMLNIQGLINIFNGLDANVREDIAFIIRNAIKMYGKDLLARIPEDVKLILKL